MASFPVYYFNNRMHGAPEVLPAKGTLIAMFDACLITGFGVTSLVDLTIVSGIATATVNSGESFDTGAIVELYSELRSEINGRYRVLASSLTTFQFAVGLPDDHIIGGVTGRYAAAEGWEKIYSETNKAVYVSNDYASHGFYYLVDDDVNARYAVIRGYESMTDIDLGSGAFPPLSLAAPAMVRAMTIPVGGAPIEWDFACDSRFILWALGFGVTTNPSYNYANPRGFGDLIPVDASDVWASIVAFQDTNTNGGNGDGMFALTGISSGPGIYAARSADGNDVAPSVSVGTPLAGAFQALSGATTSVSGSYAGRVTTLSHSPAGPNGEIGIGEVYVRHNALDNGSIRAIVPGVYFIGHRNVDQILARHTTIRGRGALEGRRLLVMYARSVNAAVEADGVYLIDVTGPWR